MIPVFIIQHLNANYTITAPTTQPKTNTPKSVLVAKSTLSMLKLNYSNYLYKETSMPGEILFGKTIIVIELADTLYRVLPPGLYLTIFFHVRTRQYKPLKLLTHTKIHLAGVKLSNRILIAAAAPTASTYTNVTAITIFCADQSLYITTDAFHLSEHFTRA